MTMQHDFDCHGQHQGESSDYYKQLEVCQKFEKSGSEGFKSCEQSSAQMSHELAEDGRYRRIWPKILAGALGVPILFYVLVRLVVAAAV
jgi:hypothetical protein